MRKLTPLVAALSVVVISTTDADARHRHHRGPDYYAAPGENGADFRRPGRSYGRARSGLAAMVPRDWHAAPRNPNLHGNRFVSPTGDAWLRFYAVPADKDGLDQYWKTVAFVDGEDLRSLLRDRAWVEVSGFRGGRMYFRKSVLACGEREWRHVEYEYPAEVQRDFVAQVERLSRTFDRAFTELCDETVGRQN